MKKHISPDVFFAAMVAGIAILFIGGCVRTVEKTSTHSVGETRSEAHIPHSLATEHAELHHQLQEAMNSGGATAESASIVAERLAPHFAKEEQYALPPLTTLPDLAQGQTVAESDRVIELADKLKAELPQMLTEHKAIVMALDELAVAAQAEGKTGAIEFTEKLRLHAQNEEEILYPAAILVGEHLKRLRNRDKKVGLNEVQDGDRKNQRAHVQR
jgi:hypothetical protein